MDELQIYNFLVNNLKNIILLYLLDTPDITRTAEKISKMLDDMK